MASPRRSADAPLPPLHRSWSPALSSTLFPLLSLLVLPLGALLLVEYSRLFALLFLGQALLALAALEWSWLMFRVRARLLLALNDGEQGEEEQDTGREADGEEGDDDDEQDEGDDDEEGVGDLETGRRPPPHSGELLLAVEDPRTPLSSGPDRRRRRRRRLEPTTSPSPATYALRLVEAQTPKTFVMERPARWRGFCGSWLLPALMLGVLLAGVGVGMAFWLAPTALSTVDSAWAVVVGATCEAALASAVGGALAPSAGDALVLAVYQGSVLAAAMNAFLRYRVGLLADDQLVDSLYVTLVAACAVLVFRVMTSRRVMESLLLVLGDALGLLCLAAPLITAADAIDRAPVTDAYRQQFALFLLVVTATDVGDALARALPFSLGFGCFRRSSSSAPVKPGRTGRDVDAAVVAWSCAALTLGVARVVMGVSVFNTAEVVVLLVAVGMGQWARLWVVAVKQMANVTSTAFYLADKSHAAGALERVALFMVALLVYYPYVKDRFITDSVSTSGSGSNSSSSGSDLGDR